MNTYDQYLGGRGDLTIRSEDDVQYPESDQRNIFGTTLLPRVYGKDLNAFEIASTGLIALTLEEIHSLDVRRDVANSNVVIETLCNDSLKFDVNSSNVFMQFDGKSNNLDVYADSDAIIEANSNLTLQVNEKAFETNVNGGALFTRMDAANALFRSHTDSNYKLTASNNTHVEADKNMDLIVNQGYFKTSVDNGAVFTKMDTANKGFTSHADSNYAVSASNNVSAEAEKDMNLTANTGVLTASVSDEAVFAKLDTASKGFTSHADSNYAVTASNNVSAEADKDMSLTANTGVLTASVSDEAVFAKLDTASKGFTSHADSNYTVTASNNVSAEADKDMSLTANTGVLSASVSDEAVFAKLDTANKGFTSHADSNYAVTASNNVSVEADKDMDLVVNQGYLQTSVNGGKVFSKLNTVDNNFRSHTDSNYDVTASNNVSVEADKDMSLTANTGVLSASVSDEAVFAKMDTANKGFTSHADSNYEVTASNDVSVEADKNMDLTANQGYVKSSVSDDAVFTKLDTASKGFTGHADSNYAVSASNNVSVEAAKSVTIDAVQGPLELTAHNDNMVIELRDSDDTVDVQSASNITLGAKNDIKAQASNDVVVASRDGGSVDLAVRMVSDSNAIYYESSGAHDFSVADDTKMLIDSSKIKFTTDNFNVNGNFKHTGSNFSSSNEVSFGVHSKDSAMIKVNDDADTVNNYVDFNASSNIKTNTSGSHQFFVDESKLMTISNSNVHIYANLNVEGTLNSVSVSETKLDVQDRLIRLATSSNYVDEEGDGGQYPTVPDDGDLNEGAGMWITGVPEGAGIPDATGYEHRSDIQDFYEKSIRWHNNTGGMLKLGSNKVTEESYWEVKGGAFYLTHMPIDNNTYMKQPDISFGFRINANSELEIVKKYVPSGQTNHVTKVVAKFGSTLSL